MQGEIVIRGQIFVISRAFSLIFAALSRAGIEERGDKTPTQRRIRPPSNPPPPNFWRTAAIVWVVLSKDCKISICWILLSCMQMKSERWRWIQKYFIGKQWKTKITFRSDALGKIIIQTEFFEVLLTKYISNSSLSCIESFNLWLLRHAWSDLTPIARISGIFK